MVIVHAWFEYILVTPSTIPLVMAFCFGLFRFCHLSFFVFIDSTMHCTATLNLPFKISPYCRVPVTCKSLHPPKKPHPGYCGITKIDLIAKVSIITIVILLSPHPTIIRRR